MRIFVNLEGIDFSTIATCRRSYVNADVMISRTQQVSISSSVIRRLHNHILGGGERERANVTKVHTLQLSALMLLPSL